MDSADRANDDEADGAEREREDKGWEKVEREGYAYGSDGGAGGVDGSRPRRSSGLGDEGS